MRILHLLDHSLPLQSGYSFRTIGILAAQRKRGWETVQMTTPKQNSFNGPVDRVDGWTFNRTRPPAAVSQRLPLLRELAQMHRTLRRLDEVIEETRPDIVQAHSPVLNGIPALQAARRHRLPMVYEVRSLWEDAAVDWGTARQGDLRYRTTRNLETFVLRRADAVTTICEGLRRDILSRGLPSGRVMVVPNAVDAERFSMRRRVDEALRLALRLDGCVVLGFIGSFYAYEGLDLLMEGAARLFRDRQDVKLLMVGGGPEKERLVEQAGRLGIADRVVFTGRVPHEEVQRYYDLVTLFVYPRHRMRLTDLVTPLKPLEAMAQGSIVVASDVGGHRELLVDGERGYLFKPDDAGALACKLAEVIDRQEDWPAMRAAGRRYVVAERTWDAVVEHYAPIYDRLVNGKNGA
ncbi:TIGR04063 family PEP-CTERM/XrtA system glycosyltransferase [Pelagibius marinus]|uniref:TIGR04063 family PEP-CTERM/XrtA system glycosyltransferase n=1 Tax=Pelagibius marinus TaxID=2762760 RepID=UPI0018727698|nr:TIGR04063 family PEP-CTERM/XrtA system glycosyltransferase [Pelagibius marinus]